MGHLDHLLMAYRCGKMDKPDLESTLFQILKNRLHKFRPEKMSGDNCADFLSWLYPRISRAIDRYQEQGSSFDTYLNTLIRLSAKEYYIRQKDRSLIEQAWWNAKSVEMEVYEEEPEYSEPEKQFKEVRNPKQMLVLLLKSYHYLSDDYLEKAARAIGMDKKVLQNMVDTLRNQRLRQEVNIQSLKERIYCQFYRCLAFERRMRASPADSSVRVRMQRSLENARKRLASMRKRLGAMRMDAPNWQIANIIGVPKGTVDSNLWTIKQNQLGRDYTKD